MRENSSIVQKDAGLALHRTRLRCIDKRPHVQSFSLIRLDTERRAKSRRFCDFSTPSRLAMTGRWNPAPQRFPQVREPCAELLSSLPAYRLCWASCA